MYEGVIEKPSKFNANFEPAWSYGYGSNFELSQ